MTMTSRGLRALLLAGAACAFLLPAVLPASAQEIPLDAPDPDYKGQIWAQNVEGDKPFLPGATVAVGGQFFHPGQKIRFSRGIHPVTPDPIVADEEGRFSALLSIPADAPLGTHPIILSTENPYHAEIVELKISQEIPLSGAELFEEQASRLAPGLYQSAFSAREGALFATSAAGWPPITRSELLKIDPETLEVIARATPPETPEGGLFAVYGLGLDETNGRVWVTNTRQDTLAVYDQKDLSLIRQFEPGLVPHARDVVFSPETGKIYVSAVGAPGLAVFDAASLAHEGMINVVGPNSRIAFSPTSLHLDAESGRIFTPNLSAPELAVIDSRAGKLEKIIPLPGAKSAIGVSYDPETKRIFVAAQGSDAVLVLDAGSGELLKTVSLGAGPLGVLFDPSSRLAWVSLRGAGTITVLDAEGEILANLDGGPQPNHLATDGSGTVFAINKGAAEDPQSDNLRRLRRAP
ncbi:YncE family protein [Neomegalonema sp.]|uniref:YncE family protein n=1 Tax=Neomegalonema sp. TaxID=2039713 RepID=UPI0026219E98|nr:YncE family protein [Neomegalonema sp.]MDD2867806.1 YncE family protein [Neomegalonema sp.]